MSYKKQKLLTLRKHLSLLRFFLWGPSCSSFQFSVLGFPFCLSSFCVLLPILSKSLGYPSDCSNIISTLFPPNVDRFQPLQVKCLYLYAKCYRPLFSIRTCKHMNIFVFITKVTSISMYWFSNKFKVVHCSWCSSSCLIIGFIIVK